MKKELAIKPKIDLSKFIYEQNDEYEQNSDRNVNMKESNANFNLDADTKLLPKAKHPSLKIRKNNNAKSKTLLKLRKNKGNDIKVQTIINRTYTKENLEDYRSQFQQSYEKLSQKYYDALDSPSKIPDMFVTSDEDMVLEHTENRNKKDNAESNESTSSDDLILPSQQDLEVVVYKKKKNLYNELFHTEFAPSRTNNQESEKNKLKEESLVIPLTLSQIFEKSVDEVEEINLLDSEKSEEHIVFSDSNNEDDLIIQQKNDVKLSTIRNTSDTEILAISSDHSDEDPIIIQSQFDSPTKFDNETHVCLEKDQERTNLKINEINNIMNESGIIFTNKDLIKIITKDSNVKLFLTNSSKKLQADILDNLNKQKNMVLLKYELYEIFEHGKTARMYRQICKLIKNIVRKDYPRCSEVDEFTKVLWGISSGRVFNLEYFTDVVFSKLCECQDIDSIKMMAMSKLIQPKKLKSLYENELGANFEMG